MSKIKPTNMSEGGLRPISMPQYPTFSISLKDFPDAKDWKVGETYSIEMKVRQESMHQSKGDKGHVSFEILEIEGDTEEADSENEGGEVEAPNYSRIK
jgi:hypothetical protein